MTTSARELSSRLADLLRREHLALADFLVGLAHFDRARAWAELGYASLFDYLHRHLALSKGSAFYRMTAARLVQHHPEIVDPLRDGRLCLTTVVELAKALEAGGGDEVVSRFFHVSKREAKAVVAELIPATSVPARTVVTAVRALAPMSSPVAGPAPSVAQVRLANREADLGQTVQPANLGADLSQSVQPANHAAPVATARRDDRVLVEEPRTAELSRIHVTVSRRLLDKLAAARAALSHSHPAASEDQVLEVGLDLILDRHAKRRGLVKKPRPPKAIPATVSKHPADFPAAAPKREPISAHVKRAVWRRDAGRCQWPLQDGGVCASAFRVELDHVVPVALGGASTEANLRCLCAAHNDRAAREVFGNAHMDRFTSRDRSAATAPAT